MQGVQVYNEIGKLDCVLVHQPGSETHNYPENDFEQVFSLRKWSRRFDIDKALSEYRQLTSIFERHGAKVLNIRELLIEALDSDNEARRELIDSYLAECGIYGKELLQAVRSKLESSTSSLDLATTVIEGIHYGETDLCRHDRHTLASFTNETFDERSLLVNPLNTLFFTRDPATPIGRGILLNHPYWHERNREVSVHRCILKHHPLFSHVPLWDMQQGSFHIEGAISLT